MHVPMPLLVQVAGQEEHTYTDEFIPQAVNLYQLKTAVNAHFGSGGGLNLHFQHPVTYETAPLVTDADLAAALKLTKENGQGTLKLVAATEPGMVLNLVPLGGTRLGHFQAVADEFTRRYSPDRLLDKKSFGQVYTAFKHLGRAEMTEAEFVEGMRKQHIITNAGVAQRYFRGFDKDNSGSLSLEEVVLGLATLTQGGIRARLRLAFEAFDDDKNGYVDVNELTRLVHFSTGLGADLSFTAAQKLIHQVDGNSDGRLDFAEFMQAVRLEPSIIATFNK
jgi:Ca2+-binding EF-hand superfamily protein